ncbi:hypothetical protein [Acuticoccus yangtzensis]|uniref:hypothetical protein n=1 Tax=Acuticoccus yangtzensis TaxID=1443441 RepID=UPI0009F7A3A7|nr:hypothetical protein [Acuticoccus yangtzensis]ORE94676.1 hypothetical protein ATO13_11391 [Stappia sp. 22II-S9-Z10]
MKLICIAAISAAMSAFALPALAGDPTDSYVVERDDRGAQKCYVGTYYPAHYKVYPKGIKLRGAQKTISVDGNRYVVGRNAPLYIETRKRIKEDYVSLAPTGC